MKLGKYFERTRERLNTPIVFVNEEAHSDSGALRDNKIAWTCDAPQKLRSLDADLRYLTTFESERRNGKEVKYAHQMLGEVSERDVLFMLDSHDYFFAQHPVVRIYLTKCKNQSGTWGEVNEKGR